MRHLFVLAFSLSLASCGDIQVKSIRVVDAVPPHLEGEWTGQWASTRGGGGGTVRLRMQDFVGEPVVSIQLDNPCIEARSYQFRTAGNLIELLADGQPLFSAVLGDTRTLTGTYSCTADGGVWTVSWIRELAPLVDLGGLWLGTVTLPGLPVQSLRLDLDFRVQGGALVILGTAQLPDVSAQTLPLSGAVFFDDATFDLFLEVPTGTAPDIGILLRGGGHVALPRVDVGLLQTNDPSLPFTQGTWRAIRSGP